MKIAKIGSGHPGEEIHISVRGLVEFILRHGDLDNRHQGTPDTAMQEGGRIHRMIQRRMGAEYQAEVPLKYTLFTENYALVVEGRADGIIHQDGRIIIDEIKGTYRELAGMREPGRLHIAQAKCYAFMYGLGQEAKALSVRITYCNMTSEELRYFYEDYSMEELTEWFESLIEGYRKWADYVWEWRRTRQKSIVGLKFPYPYREGQKELAANVYKTIYHKKKLFLEAPTGVGKTISTLYPSIQAMGKGMGEKLFYLTAKTITRTVADDTLEILRENGLHLKSIILTAKEKICFMEETECNPEYCPYARGHYDRINDAVFDLLITQENFSREHMEEYARRHMVCPFEMGLDMSLFADAVICDYNYLFDPHVYLKRFFGENSEGNYVFLIDEAHNLLERGREMYSAILWKEAFMELRREIKETVVSEKEERQKKTGVSGQMTLEMTRDMTYVSQMGEKSQEEVEVVEEIRSVLLPDVCVDGCNTEDERREVWEERHEEERYEEAGDRAIGIAGRRHGGRSVLVRRGYADKLMDRLQKCNRELLALKRECEKYRLVDEIETFAGELMRLQNVLEEYLAEPEEGKLPVRDMLLEFYFEVRHFLTIYDLLDEHYVIYTQLEDRGFFLRLFCVDPSENLKNCMLRGRSTILFSATLLPIQYYKKLLGGEAEDYEVYARSVFSPARRALLIANDVTSKFSRRSEEEYDTIARYLEEIVKNRHGNYMVFCPSYAFLRVIYGKYVENFGGEGRECLIQSESMSEEDREEFLNRFRRPEDGVERILIGFCVLGGIFSEGIDLKNDSLIGAVIVGTGLPQVNSEKEILKGYFDGSEESGFDYAYRYPGMNKVLQAAGRVIRTVEDVGVIALLDQRFLQFAYRRLFPREWEQFEVVTVDTVAKRVERFWDEWL
ncbi:ATP-dependent DNA helicase [Acetatifactor muris]|uniref:Bifunctional ATP-dependent DNA helicase/DNA polymerase III subunit epsilon n=1 Tax=Acetatifactor muris TaxID=879566 RepID=A0A2K4ZGJ0_9FIRM|nr:ATP-dependent DNA helicase [Acetatifactor muris]MCR2045814.1 ATP-dependent DNA helicase [Acetatifactor muris]SOY29552.1 bifunctional ATP-dependent DNA helicase/DNA polymerase III subunit epsilon [Acetatifactor muris]